MKSVYFVPVFNQIRELPGVLEELRAGDPACDTVLLVNNGSSDGSEELVRASGYPYLDLPRNQGVGYSYMLALDWAIEHGFEVFGTMASNGKMLPSEMPACSIRSSVARRTTSPAAASSPAAPPRTCPPSAAVRSPGSTSPPASAPAPC